MGIRDLHLTRGNFGATEEATSRRLLPLPREEMVEDVEAGDDRIDNRNVNDNSDGDGEEDSSDDDDDSSADDGFNPLLRMEEEDLEFFFGTALGKHPSLEGITSSHSRIQTRLWRLFTDNCDFLRRLALSSIVLDSECCRLLQ
jgi:hypothetical protein